MNAFRAWRRAPAAKLLLAACGVAGCTGGPVMSIVEVDPPSALTKSEQRALTAGADAGRAHVSAWPEPASRPVWTANRGRAASPAPVDPFAAASSRTGVARTSATRPATPAQVAGVEPMGRPASIRRVSHVEADPECATPAEAPGVAKVGDRRLPPAPPLGGSRPAQRESRTASPPTDPAPFARSSAPVAETAEPATSGRTVDATPVSRRTAGKPVSTALVPLDTYLVDGDRSRGLSAGRVRNDDMIVDSALLPKRAEWRDGAAARRDGASGNYPITPRRPFSTPVWEAVNPSKPAATANLPVSLSPHEQIETEPVSMVKAMPAPAALPLAPAMEAPLQIAPEPTAGNPFVEYAAPAAEPAETAATKEMPTLVAGPLFAPGPAMTAPTLAAAEAESSTPAITTAAAFGVTPARMSKAAEAKPVDLSGAARLAELESAGSGNGLGTPLTIGLALAVVAIGAFMIRSRFT